MKTPKPTLDELAKRVGRAKATQEADTRPLREHEPWLTSSLAEPGSYVICLGTRSVLRIRRSTLIAGLERVERGEPVPNVELP